MCRETARATIYMSFMYHSNNLTNKKTGNASLLALPIKEKVDKNNVFHQVIIHFLSKITLQKNHRSFACWRIEKSCEYTTYSFKNIKPVKTVIYMYLKANKI